MEKALYFPKYKISADFFGVFHIFFVRAQGKPAAVIKSVQNPDNVLVRYVFLQIDPVVSANYIPVFCNAHNPVHHIMTVTPVYGNVIFFQRKDGRYNYNLTAVIKHRLHAVPCRPCCKYTVFFKLTL